MIGVQGTPYLYPDQENQVRTKIKSGVPRPAPELRAIDKFGWEDQEGPDATVVRWELEGSQGHTHLTIVHSGFGGTDRRTEGYQLGWMEFLASLQRMHELGTGWRPVEQVQAVG
jgi:hypothetical protein